MPRLSGRLLSGERDCKKGFLRKEHLQQVTVSPHMLKERISSSVKR